VSLGVYVRWMTFGDQAPKLVTFWLSSLLFLMALFLVIFYFNPAA
jgi:hypothetical protein